MCGLTIDITFRDFLQDFMKLQLYKNGKFNRTLAIIR